MGNRIRAGNVCEIYHREGDWLFIDLGFSEKNKSCGVLQVLGQSDKVTFCDAVRFDEMVKLAKKAVRKDVCSPLNLVLEAPLSVTFNKDGNPTGRACDSKGDKHRYWYNQPAPALILAAGFLLRALDDCASSVR